MQKIHYNYTAFLQRYTMAIEANLKSGKSTYIIRRACECLKEKGFDDYLQYQAIKFWSDKFKFSTKVLKSYRDGTPLTVLSHTEKLREFLSSFTINENEITGELDIQRNGVKFTYDELKILCDDEGISTLNLNKLLKSSNKNITVVNLHNPLKDLFKQFADNYRGEPVIDQLSDCLKALDFNDNPDPGFYQKRLKYLFHKWLCKAAGQAMNIYTNDVMLLFLEYLGGSGKSRLIQWLFSLPEIQPYYIRISENESFMDMKGISRAKFVIDWDELPLSKKRYIPFKSHITNDIGQQYSKSKKGYESYVRQVNFIGSSNMVNRENHRGFLLDEDHALMRRIAPVELDGKINYAKYTKDIDLTQLWGQAVTEILRANEKNDMNLLTWECDYIDLRRQNSRYINASALDDKSVLKKLFIPCGVGEGRLMSSSEIIATLKQQGIKLNMNKWELGNYLANNSYNYGRLRNVKGWWIK